jgi:protein ImuB
VMKSTYTVRPALPTNQKQLWIKLLHLELEAHPPQGAILALAITAEPSINQTAQLGLFTPQLPEPARLDVTVARIRAIVGEGCVGQPVLLDTHQPQSFRTEKFAVPPKSKSVGSLLQPRAAVRQMRPAETISVTVQNSRLETFVFRGRRYVVKQAYGPWMTSGEWWGQSPWNLEQWDVVADEQEEDRLLCCCLIHDLIQNRWQLTALHD